MLKKCLNGGSIGYWIAGRFIVLKDLRKEFKVIEVTEYPF